MSGSDAPPAHLIALNGVGIQLISLLGENVQIASLESVKSFFFFVVLVAPEGLWLVYATLSKATLTSWLKCFTFFNVLYVILEEIITASQLHYCNCSQAEYKLLKVI